MTGFERITWFYERLKAEQYPNRGAFIAQFEVSGSTFKRDLAFFRDRLGAPVEYDQAKGGYFLTDQSFELPPFWLNYRQLLIIAALCRQLEQFTPSSEMTVLRRRILEMLTLRSGRQLDIYSFENAPCVVCDNENFDLLSQAMLTGQVVLLTYRDGKSGNVTSRKVEPYRLHNYDGCWYLIGFCRLRREPRNFQLARILDLTILEERYDGHHFKVAEYINTPFGIFKGKALTQVVLRFTPGIAPIIQQMRWHLEQKITHETDGSLLLTIPVADFTEIRMKILQYGHQVEVISPPELRRQVALEAAAIRKLYQIT